MSHIEPQESRIAALIREYADRAPIDVDPMAVARLAAGSPAATSGRFGVRAPGRALVFAVVVFALLASIVAGAFIGGVSRQDPVEILTERALLKPFSGLPPADATPSLPETGVLVWSQVGIFDGREMLWSFVYEDGRFVWALDHDRGVIVEQYLTPRGVELLRSRVEEASLIPVERLPAVELPRDYWVTNGPGVPGGLTLRRNGELIVVPWADPALPQQLADPGSWLPRDAWRDARIGGFVPARYVVCVPSRLAALPLASRELLAIRGARSVHGCQFELGLDDARDLVTTFVEAGLRRRGWLHYLLPPQPGAENESVQLLPILPGGEVVCNCG